MYNHNNEEAIVHLHLQKHKNTQWEVSGCCIRPLSAAAPPCWAFRGRSMPTACAHTELAHDRYQAASHPSEEEVVLSDNSMPTPPHTHGCTPISGTAVEEAVLSGRSMLPPRVDGGRMSEEDHEENQKRKNENDQIVIHNGYLDCKEVQLSDAQVNEASHYTLQNNTDHDASGCTDNYSEEMELNDRELAKQAQANEDSAYALRSSYGASDWKAYVPEEESIEIEKNEIRNYVNRLLRELDRLSGLPFEDELHSFSNKCSELLNLASLLPQHETEIVESEIARLTSSHSMAFNVANQLNQTTTSQSQSEGECECESEDEADDSGCMEEFLYIDNL